MLNIILRALLLFSALLIMLRIMGKRQIGQLQPYEFALMLISSNLITIPMSQLDIPLLWGIVPIYVMLASGICLSLLTIHSNFFRRVVCGTPRILIDKGVVSRSSLRAVRYNLNDLLEQLRSNDVFDVSQVYYAILETNGEISVILKAPYRTVQTADLSLKVLQEIPETALILDGRIMDDNLKYINKNRPWLSKVIKKT